VTVYVDDVRHRYRLMIMCHMWSESVFDLMDMAQAIGVSCRWIQLPPKASWVHFDICLDKKRLALARGAVLTDRYGPVEHVAKLQLICGDEAAAISARRRIAQISQIRARHAPAQGSLL
jgi:hypothetical protein